MKIKIFYFFLFTPILFSCYNDTEEELYGITVCNFDNVTYSLNVAPIISNNCYACHSQVNAPSNGAGIVLEGYNKLIIAANNGLLLESITHGPNASPMPKNAPQISDCNINTIKTWITNGAKND
jgi:hypothetical protein